MLLSDCQSVLNMSKEKGRNRSCRFRRIFRVAFERLFWDRLGQDMSGDCPAGLEPLAGARNWRKATVQI